MLKKKNSGQEISGEGKSCTLPYLLSQWFYTGGVIISLIFHLGKQKFKDTKEVGPSDCHAEHAP